MPRRREDDGPACIVCGCTQNNACDGGCSWVAADLCSACQASWEHAVDAVRSLNRNWRKWSVERRTAEVARACRRVQDEADPQL